MMNFNRAFKVLCFIALLANNSVLGQIKHTTRAKLAFCINPYWMAYGLNKTTVGTPPYTMTWTENGNVIRTAPTFNTYSPDLGYKNYHDSIHPPSNHNSGLYTTVARMTNTSGYDSSWTWIIQYDSLYYTKTDMGVTCTGNTPGSISISGWSTTDINDYDVVLNPGNVPGPNYPSLPAGNYTVTITSKKGGWLQDGNGGTNYTDMGLAKCTSTINITITQPAILSAIATNSKTGTCGLPNGEVSVNTTGGTGSKSYLWSPGGAVSQTVNNLAIGNYTVTVTDGMGCTSTSSASITNSGALTATMGTPVDVGCFGGNTGSSTVTVGNGTANFTYAWTTGAPITNASTSNTISNLTAGGYTVTITDSKGCTATSNVTITQPPGMTLPLPTTTSAVCGNNNGTIGVTPSGGTSPYNYSWTGGSLAQTATGLAAGSYTVTVTDNKGCSQTTNATIAGTGSATVIITGFNAVTCFGANNGNATASGSGGSGTYTYSWSNGQTTAVATGLAPGTHTVIVNSGGCLDTTTVTINEPPDIVLTSAGTTAACGKNTGQVSVSPAGGSGAYTYLWTPGGSVAQTVNNLAAGNYTVTVKDANGCTKTSTTTITNIAGPTVTADPPTSVTCKGAATGSVSATPNGGTPTYSFTWNSNPVQNANSATNLVAGIYTVTVSDANGCTATTSSTITEPPKLNTTLPTPKTACIGQNATVSTTASGGTPVYNYMWNPGGITTASATVTPAGTTTYTVVVTDANGCTTSQTVVVSVNPPLVVNSSGAASICNGTSTTISAVGSGGNGGPYTYSWMPGGLTGISITVTPPPGPTDYTVTVTDGCGTPSATSIVTVTVNPPPAIQFAADVTNGCAPLVVTFTNSTANPAFCFWDFGDGSSSSVCNDSAHTYLTAGIYSVKLTVTDTNGCVNSLMDTAMIRVSAPVADFDMSSTRVTIYEPSVAFTDKSTNANDWLWDFGDSTSTTNSSMLTNPAHTYSDTGLYCIKLIIHDTSGCVSNITKCLVVIPVYTFYVPNAFSPNGDNINESFNGKGSGIKTYKMLVFDRWGNLIFTTTDINIGWNGCVKGSSTPVQQDVYVYKIVVDDIFDVVHNYIGHVSVVR
jgi:gliding motility-associated-like protein